MKHYVPDLENVILLNVCMYFLLSEYTGLFRQPVTCGLTPGFQSLILGVCYRMAIALPLRQV